VAWKQADCNFTILLKSKRENDNRNVPLKHFHLEKERGANREVKAAGHGHQIKQAMFRSGSRAGA